MKKGKREFVVFGAAGAVYLQTGQDAHAEPYAPLKALSVWLTWSSSFQYPNVAEHLWYVLKTKTNPWSLKYHSAP